MRRVVRLIGTWLVALGLIVALVDLTHSLEAGQVLITGFGAQWAALAPDSLAALDRFEKIRGTASSGQAFIQMLLSTLSAGLIVPFLWFSPLGLSIGMLGYFILSILVIYQTKSLV